jgi:uncharacterized protein (UPF0147 family)
MTKEFEEVIFAIDEMLDDEMVPRNVKKKMEETRELLLKEEVAASIRINQALNKLEELSEETNINPFTRTQIWNVVSMLESI